MDSPLLILFIVLLSGFCGVIVESQQNVNPPPLQFSPPPPSPPPPPPPPPPLSPPPPPPPLLSPPHFAPPPPVPRKRLRPPVAEHGNNDLHKNLSPPMKKEKANTGKIIGMMFTGVAAILQVCVVAFLLISRRQLLKVQRGC